MWPSQQREMKHFDLCLLGGLEPSRVHSEANHQSMACRRCADNPALFWRPYLRAHTPASCDHMISHAALDGLTSTKRLLSTKRRTVNRAPDTSRTCGLNMSQRMQEEHSATQCITARPLALEITDFLKCTRVSGQHITRRPRGMDAAAGKCPHADSCTYKSFQLWDCGLDHCRMSRHATQDEHQTDQPAASYSELER